MTGSGLALTLADLHAAPIFVYFPMTEEAGRLIPQFPGLQTWWHEMSERDSIAATRSPLE